MRGPPQTGLTEPTRSKALAWRRAKHGRPSSAEPGLVAALLRQGQFNVAEEAGFAGCLGQWGGCGKRGSPPLRVRSIRIAAVSLTRPRRSAVTCGFLVLKLVVQS